MKTRCWMLAAMLLASGCCAGPGAQELNVQSIPALEDWRTWSRTPSALKASSEDAGAGSGHRTLRLEHGAADDWSLQPPSRIKVRAGDIVELKCQAKLNGEGSATLCFSTWDAHGQVVSWSAAESTLHAEPEWRGLRSRLVTPANVVEVQPRVIGHGKATIWVSSVTATNTGNVASLRATGTHASLDLRSETLVVRFDPDDGTLSVAPLPGGRGFVQKVFANDCVVKSARVQDGRIECEMLHVPNGLDLTARIYLEPAKPEIVVELTGQGEMPAGVLFPHPFESRVGDYLVIPMNEGISYPVDDKEISPMRLIAYGGHGICMAFYGVTDGSAGQMTILETPDDASIRIDRLDNRWVVIPEWEAQRGQFGYTRRLRHVFFQEGGHVGMAKRYRAYAREIGLLKTLEEKRRANPNVDLLIGAVNVWCWDQDAVTLAREMKAAGIERILWSNRQSPESIRALNEIGVLTSRYDIYQDVMAPTNFSRLRWIHPDWTTNAWPQDIMLDRRGNWIKGWGVEAKDSEMIPCGVLCDRRAVDYARERVPPELATHAYRARFIDTTTASPWRECYHPQHPMTRTDSRKWKMSLLRYISENNQLVTGCETGHDASVPFLHYFEGMMSLGPYRVPDSGRRMSEIWTNVPPRVAKFQLGHVFRLPLWELVFHDCVVAQWYWGDYNNKLPALWDRRDLFNLLYGTAPMFMFNRDLWRREKARFVQSYQNTCPTVRRTGYSEMVDHRFLTSDRTVQQTEFANGIIITVNFGDSEYRLPDGKTIKSLGFTVTDR